MTESPNEVQPDVSATAPPHIETRDLTRRYGDFTALMDINLAIARGAIEVVIGGSGAGKTTLLKLLIGLERPSSGTILIGGEDTTKMGGRDQARIRTKLGMVFQYSALLDSLNVFENVAFPLREHRRDLSEKALGEKVRAKLEALELIGIEKRMPSEISGGMRKRVGLARALMLEPEAIFYDEPTSGLDPLTARLVDDMILSTRAKFGVTSVVISHDMAGALRTADKIHLLKAGRLEISATPEDLLNSGNALAEQFFVSSGISAKNLIEERKKSLAEV